MDNVCTETGNANLTHEQIAEYYKSFRTRALPRLRRKFRFTESDAEEVIQETFCQAFYGTGARYNPALDGGTLSWMMRLVDCRAYDWLRSRSRRAGILNRFQPAASFADPEGERQGRVQAGNRRAIMEKLPPDLQILYGCLSEGYKPLQISRRLQLPVTEVRNLQRRLKRAVCGIAEQLGLCAKDLY